MTTTLTVDGSFPIWSCLFQLCGMMSGLDPSVFSCFLQHVQSALAGTFIQSLHESLKINVQIISQALYTLMNFAGNQSMLFFNGTCW